MAENKASIIVFSGDMDKVFAARPDLMPAALADAEVAEVVCQPRLHPLVPAHGVGELALGPLAAYLPRAALAGLIFLVAATMVDRSAVARILKTSRAESGIMLSTFAANNPRSSGFWELAGSS